MDLCWPQPVEFGAHSIGVRIAIKTANALLTGAGLRNRISTSVQSVFQSIEASSYTYSKHQCASVCQDTTRTQNSLFGIRNLRKPRELSQPNQLDMVGPSGRF